MTHDHSHDTHAPETSQGTFIGWLGIGLLALMALFTLMVLIGATTGG